MCVLRVNVRECECVRVHTWHPRLICGVCMLLAITTHGNTLEPMNTAKNALVGGVYAVCCVCFSLSLSLSLSTSPSLCVCGMRVWVRAGVWVRKRGLCVSAFDAMCVCVLCALDVCARGLVHRCEGGTECVGMYVRTSVVRDQVCACAVRRVGARCSGVESVF